MKKGQIVIDYLLIMAIILILALVTIALFDVIPDYGQSMRIKQSVDFWQNQARPISVVDSIYRASDQKIYLALTSRQETKLSIEGIYVNGTKLAFFEYDGATGGAGADLCDVQTCKFSSCDCSKNLSPFSTIRIVTETYLGANDFCDPKTKERLVPFQINYSSYGDPLVELSQQSAYPLAIKCN